MARGRPARDYDSEKSLAWRIVKRHRFKAIVDEHCDVDYAALMEDPGVPLGQHRQAGGGQDTGHAPARMPRHRKTHPSMKMPGPNAQTEGGPVTHKLTRRAA